MGSNLPDSVDFHWHAPHLSLAPNHHVIHLEHLEYSQFCLDRLNGVRRVRLPSDAAIVTEVFQQRKHKATQWHA